MFTVVSEPAGEDRSADGLVSSSVIDQLVWEGARRMLAEALRAEVDAYIAAFADERDGHGRRLVVRNGVHEAREVVTAAGAVEVTARSTTSGSTRTPANAGGSARRSCRRGCARPLKITEVLPLLYLHGLSSGDFVPALGQFLGTTAGLSGPVVTRLAEQWKTEQRVFAQRDLSGVDYVYLWADGIHVNIRLDEPAGDGRSARRRPQGTHRPGRRVSGVHRVVGPAA